MAAAAAIGITVASVVIPAAVSCVTYAAANSKLGHKETVVKDREELIAGTHISYQFRNRFFDKFSYRHAIVAEDVVARDGLPLKLIYWFDGRVIYEDVPLIISATETGSPPVYIHHYTPFLCYEDEKVAERARNLSTEYVQPERHSVINNYWKCFDDNESFAVWCHTGVHFAKIVRGMFSTDYKYTKVTSIGCLGRGDHVCFQSNGSIFYQHGIIEKLNVSENTISVICKTKSSNSPQRVPIKGSDIFGQNSRDKLYRYNYDIALGYCGETVVRTAINETQLETRGNTHPVYQTDVEFAVWCKLSGKISPNDASTLAKARVSSALHRAVTSKADLSPGDHVEIRGQHCIIETVKETWSGTQLTVIFMPNVEPGTGKGEKITQKTFEKVEDLIVSKRLQKYFYDGKVQDSGSEVFKRARRYIGKDVDELPFKDAQHFAMSCRTGAHQLHDIGTTAWYWETNNV